jgi:glucose-6-phosphate-specific signal transduction histidine kinase
VERRIVAEGAHSSGWPDDCLALCSCLLATRQLSLDQFYLPAGIRVAAVLLCPPRLWPYLLLGEYAYFAQSRVPMIEKYGLTWVIVASAFLMPAVMLIVKLQRRLMASRRRSASC